MWITALIPFLLQAITILVDEGYFHVKRGLPKWERIGHPIDTFSVLLCMGFVIWVPFSQTSLICYVLLATISSILVTKDEWIHKSHCPASEMWLHALLFTLHPITLTVAGFIWPVTQGIEVSAWISLWLTQAEFLKAFLEMQFCVMGVFLIYQIVFWNFIWVDKPILKQ